MRLNSSCTRRVAWAVAILALTLGATAGASDVIGNGADLWATAGSGLTYSSFESEPIPAGFFCPGSAPFSGKIAFEGVPLATEPAGELGAIDTIVRRLDDAAFDADGVARTRIQLMALSLASAEPIETECGRFDVAAALTGEQPLTEMRIVRLSDRGGTYSAPLALNVRLVFTPVEGDLSGRRELEQRVDLGPGTFSFWSYAMAAPGEPVIRVDTDGDGMPDAWVPAPSNFMAGVAPASTSVEPSDPVSPSPSPGPTPVCSVGQCAYQSCHCTPWDQNPEPFQDGSDCSERHLHCVWVCVSCDLIGVESI